MKLEPLSVMDLPGEPLPGENELMIGGCANSKPTKGRWAAKAKKNFFW